MGLEGTSGCVLSGWYGAEDDRGGLTCFVGTGGGDVDGALEPFTGTGRECLIDTGAGGSGGVLLGADADCSKSGAGRKGEAFGI